MCPQTPSPLLQGEGPEPQLPPGSEEYVVELLSQSEQKLLLLQEELQGKDLAAVMKEMEEEEVGRGRRRGGGKGRERGRTWRPS